MVDDCEFRLLRVAPDGQGVSEGAVARLRLVECGGQMFTLDNRRLVAFQKSGVSSVPFVRATATEAAAEAWRFTT
ncbi:hypothetical protein Prum_012240 [Phytohabitans rumicis]|uniref:Uncharacterized protein n=1 Tax=Phytohabitans rumicis TaxID=1076125 RepID=A0A6V8KQY9_9ACTN|nr:hypothetical protein Prum_012240 [Phytohabitans rumicis]